MSNALFIGLGVMGLPMAQNLLRAGHRVTGHNRSPERIAKLVDAGAEAAVDLHAAAAAVDVLITVLPDGPDVVGVLLEGGLLDACRPGTLIVDLSTISPATARTIAHEARGRGLRPLDAPVSGGEQGAIEGALSIMVGGQPSDVEAARPVLEAMGSTVVRVGPSGAGQTVKAANQLVVAGNIQLLSEALLLLSAQGVDLQPALQVLGGGLAGSTVLDRKAPGMLQRRFAPGFRTDLHHKDLGIVAATAREAEVPLPVTALVTQLLAATRAQGNGALDHSALLLTLEAMAGRRAT